jgi:histone H3/H4|tara:strand:+ start:409 stop:786 length:378 start_codon:yes stop_codon:yes gene_type:complete
MFDFLRVDLLMPLLQAGALWLIGEGVKLVRKKTKVADGHILNQALNVVNETAENVVTSLAETTVKGYKKEGKFTAELAKEVKDNAINKIISTVGPKVTGVVEKAGEDLTEYVSDLIERKLKLDKY